MGGANDAAERATEALLRAGGVGMRLRVPAPAAAGDDAEQLGLATPEFAEIELGRGVLRNTSGASGSVVLMLAAGPVTKACGQAGSPAVEALFAGAVGISMGETLYRIEGCEAMRAGDGVYAYSVTLTKTEH